jgi:hypothetical protein
MSEDEGGAGDVPDLAGAGGDVAEGAPAAGEQGEPAFAQATQGTLDGVAGAGIDIQFPPASGLFYGDEDADARILVAGVG